jgi:hypothetical protein
VDAFATYQELGLRLKRTFTVGEESEWITTLLEDASTYLRDDVLGLQVYPQATATFVAWADGGQIELPQTPVISVDSVKQNGTTLDYTRRDNTLFVRTDDAVEVTFTYGYPVAPESLKRWACVLVSQTLMPLELKLGLTAGGLSSVAIDDFKVAFADAGEATGMQLSDRNIASLRAQFGVTGSYVVGTR